MVVERSERRSSDGGYYMNNIFQKLSTSVLLGIIEPGHNASIEILRLHWIEYTW